MHQQLFRVDLQAVCVDQLVYLSAASWLQISRQNLHLVILKRRQDWYTGQQQQQRRWQREFVKAAAQ
jgi:hypothetical protein